MPTRKAHARWEGSLEKANAAKAGCPVSQALAGTEITLGAKLAAA